MALATVAKNILSNGNAVHPDRSNKTGNGLSQAAANHKTFQDNISLVSISTVASSVNITKPQPIVTNVTESKVNERNKNFKTQISSKRPTLLITDHSDDECDSIGYQSRSNSAEPPEPGKLFPASATGSPGSKAAGKWIRAGKQVRQAVAAAQAFQRPESRQEKVRRHIYGSKASIPVLPVPIAVMFLIFNILVPGLGTILSGFTFCCCATTYDKPDRKGIEDKIPGLVCKNFSIGLAQLFTVTFILVGWFWSISWGIAMVHMAVDRKREKARGNDWYSESIG